MLSDHGSCSSARDLLKQQVGSMHIPPANLPLTVPAELDPPESLTCCRIMNKVVAPAGTARMGSRIA